MFWKLDFNFLNSILKILVILTDAADTKATGAGSGLDSSLESTILGAETRSIVSSLTLTRIILEGDNCEEGQN